MKYIVDTERQTLTTVGGDESNSVTQSLCAGAAFELLSRQWVRTGWSLGYFLAFTWMGQPILQLPEDLVRLQEIIHQVRPDLIIETGVYKGGSLLYYASLCRTLGKGRVIGIDISIPPDVREVLRKHPLNLHFLYFTTIYLLLVRKGVWPSIVQMLNAVRLKGIERFASGEPVTRGRSWRCNQMAVGFALACKS